MKRQKTAPKSKRPLKRSKSAVGDYQRGRELARTPKQELKAFDVALTTTTFPVAGVVTAPLNVPVNGAELYQRVGRKIYMKSLHIRGVITNNATAVQDGMRIIVYYDSQSNGGAPTTAAMIQDSNAAAAFTVYSEINLTNRQRFKILRDHQVIVPSVSNAAGVLTNQAFQETAHGDYNISMFIKLKGLESIFNATNGGTVADITSGSIGMFLISATNNNLWQFNWQSRLRYYD